MVAIDQPAIARSGDDRCPGGRGEGGSRAGVVAVPVGEEDAFEWAVEAGEGGEDGRGAIGESGIDEDEAAGWEVDEVDVGSAGAADPTDSWDDVVGRCGGHEVMVAGWSSIAHGERGGDCQSPKAGARVLRDAQLRTRCESGAVPQL